MKRSQQHVMVPQGQKSQTSLETLNIEKEKFPLIFSPQCDLTLRLVAANSLRCVSAVKHLTACVFS